MVAMPSSPKKRAGGKYRRMQVHTWTDEGFCALTPIRPSGQSLWIYLIVGPFTGPIPGLFCAGEAAMAEALRWPLSAFRRCWKEVEAADMGRADWHSRVVWLPNGIKHNEPPNPDVVLGWRGPWREIPECSMKVEAGTVIRTHLATLGDGYVVSWDHMVRHTDPIHGVPHDGTHGRGGSGAGAGAGAGAGGSPPPLIRNRTRNRPPTAEELLADAGLTDSTGSTP